VKPQLRSEFALLAAMAAIGVVMLVLAWRGVALSPYPPLELPWLLSGGLAGLTLIGLAGCAATILIHRRDNAVHRARIDRAVSDTIAELQRRAGEGGS
jgi:hypothetical protein